MTAPWATPSRLDREYVAAASDARLANDPLLPPPPIAAPPVPGRFELIDDRGVYLREIPADGGGRPDPALPATLYIHGLAGSSTNFASLGSVLAARTRGFAVDLPGFGRSDPPPACRFSLIGDADLMAALIDRISPDAPVHIVGNSLGGMVAVALASRHPQRVRTLSLISPAVPDLRFTADRGADPRLALLLAPGTMRMATRRLSGVGPLDRARGMAALCYGDPSVLTDSDIELAAIDLAWRYPLPWAHASTVLALRALMRSYLRYGKWSFRAAAARTVCPALVVWGTRDRLVDAALAVPTAVAFPNGRLLVLPGRGHVAHMEDPVTTARAILALWQDAEAGREIAAFGAPLAGPAAPVATSTE